MKVMALLRKKDSHITHNDKAAKFRTSLNFPHPQILHVCKFLRKTYVLFGKITAGCAHYGSQDLELLAIIASYLWLVKTEKRDRKNKCWPFLYKVESNENTCKYIAQFYWFPKGQLISKCPYEILVSSKMPLYLDFCPGNFCSFL